jgi:hypothetical protein
MSLPATWCSLSTSDAEAAVQEVPAQYQQEAGAGADPWHQLRKEEGKHHAQASLDVLQGQVLCIGSTIRLSIVIIHLSRSLTFAMTIDKQQARNVLL